MLCKHTKKIVRLGHDTIYPNQDSVGTHAYSILKNEDVSVNISLQCQDGKCGSAAVSIKRFLDDRKVDGKTFVIVWILSLASNNLREHTCGKLFLKQRSSRNTKSTGMKMHEEIASLGDQNLWIARPGNETEGMYVVHRDGIPALIPHFEKHSADADYTFVIDDEIDFAFVKDGRVDNGLSAFGIKLNAPKAEWPRIKAGKQCYLLATTSTDSYARVDEQDGGQLFRTVYSEPGSTYTGICDDRYKYESAEPLTKKIITIAALLSSNNRDKYACTAFAVKMLKQFKADCALHGMGSFILRAPHNNATIDALIVLCEDLGIKVRVYEYESDTIRCLIPDLSEEHTEPVLRIIKRSFTAGMTLQTHKYIRGRYEPSSQHDSAYQALGRSYGHIDASCRAPYRYPIYCDLNVVDHYRSYFHSLNINKKVAPPPSRNTKIVSREDKYRYELVKALGADDEAVKKLAYQYRKPGVTSGIRFWISTDRARAKSWRDLGQQILDGSQVSGGDNKPYILVKIDAANPRAPETWSKVMDKYGKYEGEWILLHRVKATAIGTSTHRTRSAMYN